MRLDSSLRWCAIGACVVVALSACSSSATSAPTVTTPAAVLSPNPSPSEGATTLLSPAPSVSQPVIVTTPTPATTVLKIIDVCTANLPSPLPTIKVTTPPTTDPQLRGIIAHLQKNLPKLGYKAGPVSGVYDPKTVIAVKKFQSDRNILADGIFGTETWDRWFIDACGID